MKKKKNLSAIDELREVLNQIPKEGAINKARRKLVQAQIFALIREGDK